MEELKRTPLFPLYERYGGKTIDFGGWALPVQFKGIVEEHETVRARAGLFDVSHMGEIEIAGTGALAFLQYVVTNDVSRLEPGQAQYTPICYPHGGTVDDILVYCKGTENYLLVVNAANTDKDEAWLRECLEHWQSSDIQGDAGVVHIRNVSHQTVQIALQGPYAQQILAPLCSSRITPEALPYYRFVDGVTVAGIPALVSRTGYTGEDGFEVYTSAADGVRLWEALIEAGAEEGLIPCGLGARDTLRLEARFPLYGHELTDTITPLEAGLGIFVKLDKGNFVGSEALRQQKENGLSRRIVAIEMTGRGIPRQGYDVHIGEWKIGVVTSGTFSPTLKKNIGLALVEAPYAMIGQQFDVIIRNKPVEAVVVKSPFYKRGS